MNRIFEKSLELARALYPSDFGERRCWHLSLVFERTKLVIAAENSVKSHPKNLYNLKNFDIAKKGCCSELILARRARKFDSLDWRRITFINIRINRNGELKNSAPCSSCQNLLFGYLGVKNCYHTDDDGNFVEFSID